MEEKSIDSEDESRRTLLCKNIPLSLLKRQTLKDHFEKFGTITKLLTSIEKGIAYVEFETHGQAANAKKLGTDFYSHQLTITWKKRLSRTSSSDDSKVEKGSPGFQRSGLFGKTASSTAGERVPTKVGARLGVRGHAPSGHVSVFNRLSHAGVGQSSSHRQSTPFRPVKKGMIKREPVDQSLYGDLPPPDDWSEESVSQTTSKTASIGDSQVTKPNIRSKNMFGNPRGPSSGSGSLFGKKTVFKKEAFSAPEHSHLRKPHPFIKEEKTDTPFQDTRAQPVSAQSTVGTSGQVLFGKPSTSHSISTAFQPSEISADRGKVALFGKKMQGGESQSTSMQPEDNAYGENYPRLFGQPLMRRSVSPKRSVMERLSPARTSRTARTAPSSPAHHAALYTGRRSPSPGASVLFQPQDGTEAGKSDDESGQVEIEWIMPPSLAALGQMTAMNSSERQSLLDKREKFMRLGMNKQSDISKARATKGCCPDMCPERERYMREEQRRVHVYEMLPNTDSHPQINHKIAVKEYSRSSADQEEPLPLELRPTHVLTRTMDYLCNNIMDVGKDGAWADWYDFLWNRTRAIRKDITQQHLCSQASAGLVEKCVRFHIYCGARLIEENSTTFDTKINNENLTKCLQTLKEMYTDLSKRGVVCKNEAEFRAYFVLMNLNEGDTLREVQQLREEVRNSQEINFALSAYAALSEKNFVKFFKLVEATTFLNACVLHRYFNQIRADALKIILKAYSAPKGPASLPCKRLFTMLRFEDDAEGSAFLQHFGITADSSTALSREHFIEPESPVSSKRSPTLVEGKLVTSLGEAVYGKALPPNILIDPTSSFNEQGYFIGIIKPPTVQPNDTRNTVQEEPAVHLPPPEQIPQVVKDCTKMVILEVLGEEISHIAKESLKEVKRLLADTEIQVKSIASEIVTALIKETALKALTEAKNEKSAEERLERQRLTDKLSGEYVSDLIEKVQRDECKAVAADVYRKAKQEVLEKQQAECARAVRDQLIHTHLVSLMEEIAREVYQSDVLDRLAALEMAEKNTQTVLSRRLFKQWIAAYRHRTHLKRAMLTFPGAQPVLPIKRSKDFKVTHNTLQLNKRSRLAVLPLTNLKEELELSVHRRQLTLIVSNAPLNMSRILASALDGDTNGSDYMKLLLLHPEGTTDEGEQLSNWLTNKLSAGSVSTESPDTAHGKLLSHYTVTVERQPSQVNQRFGVCVRSCPTLSQSQGLQRSLYGANMALALLPFAEEPDHNYWGVFRKQLRLFLQSKPLTPAVPLLLLSPFTLPKETIQYEAGIYELLDQGLISRVRVDRLDNTIDYNKELPGGIEWLVASRPEPPDVRLTEVKSLVESFLTCTFYAKVYQDLASRQQRDVVHMDVGDLITYFNTTLARLEEFLCDAALQSISWPVYESKAGCLSVEECRCLLYEGMQLPEFQQHESDDWQHTCADIALYLDTLSQRCRVTSQHKWMSNQPGRIPALYSSVSTLLTRTESLFTSRCERQFHNPPPLLPLRQNAPWLHIIVACVELLVSTIDPLVHAMHRPYDRYECPTPLPTAGTEVSYVETMTAAMQIALKEADDSYIDMDEPVHTGTCAAASLDVSEELNASRRFEEFLKAQLEEPCALVDGSEVRGLTAAGDDFSDSHADLSTLIEKECSESRAFEMFLNKSLLES